MSLWCYECKLPDIHGQLVKTIGKLWKTQTIVLLTEQQREIEPGFFWVGFFLLSPLEFGAHSLVVVSSSQSSLPYTGHLPKVYKYSSLPDGSVSIELIAREYPHILRDLALACVLMCVDLHMRTPRNTSKHTWAMHICTRTHLYIENDPPVKYKWGFTIKYKMATKITKLAKTIFPTFNLYKDKFFFERKR